MSAQPEPYYLKGSPTTIRLNKVIGWLARRGLSLAGSAELSVRGRKSGQMQRIPVNPHTYEGAQYLVSARGHSQWVKNMLAAGGGELRVGRKVRTFEAVELADDELKREVLRTYLERWGWQVNEYFKGVTAKSSDAEISAASPDHPVFRITVAD
ncbi:MULTISPECIES: nitroreductase family deazaflavin-dependent oxidoreductase [unclassified Streptomyces]|uniref:nitroreductase family deazaflavin-dependent oxidoreductase n=1 Tax=unclassified Streptomyces TaxID=2593676 RepID=UPI000DBA4E68|nr:MULTISPECIES: nitroreductase family deazaflavin-dependent oxidoreductase [unclassified Streptomyces]MYT75074.1 nitroreductase family deazaflavin-dependent oxidoreductase [Streptomyces sp. SID8367]RAJ77030.1 deazaflavin-dependent oxidoreductase (nitroreductase family) [Streptomyces sp. PsTaAH-137]